jgi:hypothetical protein
VAAAAGIEDHRAHGCSFLPFAGCPDVDKPADVTVSADQAGTRGTCAGRAESSSPRVAPR